MTTKKKTTKSVLVHMAYYDTEAEVISETDKSVKVRIPRTKIGEFLFSPFELWVSKDSVETIRK